ncbi:MAG: hypothetical protein EBZ50_12400, partial [Alphaproteobacteria bacterium]|nr:hypothetical protein [Alphaproteobacteria bacterium]
FVDVLTTVIMVVTFLLVIMSAAVMTLSQNIVAEIREKARVDAEAKLGSNGAPAATGERLAPKPDSALISSTPQKGDAAIIALARSIAEAPKVKASAPADEQSPQTSGAIVKSSSALLTIEFDASSTKIDPDAEAKAIEIVRANPDALAAKVEIWSTAPSFASYSVAERQAYYRALNARSLLIKAGLKPSAISAQLKVADDANLAHQIVVVIKP